MAGVLAHILRGHNLKRALTHIRQQVDKQTPTHYEKNTYLIFIMY